MSVTKNDDFLKMCHEGHLGPPVSDKKVSLTKNDDFLKMCHKGHLGSEMLRKPQNVPDRTESWPDDPNLSLAGFGLV